MDSLIGPFPSSLETSIPNVTFFAPAQSVYVNVMTYTNSTTNKYKQELGDAELVQAASTGDTWAFATLIDRHRIHLERLLRAVLSNRFELEDIWQETLLRAFLNLDSLRDPSRFGAWLCSIGLNLARTERRGRLLSAVSFETLTEGEQCSEYSERSPEYQYIHREQAARVHGAIADLPPAEREAIMLVYLSELSHKEAASQLGSSLSAVKVRVHRGRRRLRTTLAGEFQPVESKSQTLLSAEPSSERIEETSMIQVDIHDVVILYFLVKEKR
ncbi:RNA polymerase sigma factor [Chloroflexi bacterium TSY]|nr:RNA polymerase sigma factor [Chloroflexi bacterium TSY]